MPLTDEWSGLANLLANLIEKYASELGIDDMPAPSVDHVGIMAGAKIGQSQQSDLEIAPVA